jgi:hypothetical protein
MARPHETEIVHAPNHLKARTAAASGNKRGMTLDQMVGRADAALTQIGVNYPQIVAGDLADLGELARSLRATPEQNPALVKRIHRKAFDVKCQAGTFDYAVLTEIAGSLCDFIDARQQAQRPILGADEVAMSVLDMHVNSLRLAFERGMKGPLGRLERELVDGLARVVDKTTGKAAAKPGGSDG